MQHSMTTVYICILYINWHIILYERKTARSFALAVKSFASVSILFIFITKINAAEQNTYQNTLTWIIYWWTLVLLDRILISNSIGKNGKLILMARRRDWDRSEIKNKQLNIVARYFGLQYKPSTGVILLFHFCLNLFSLP